jgi:endonuclease/exonuclease/phosphatase (EEP) superfamily protein YafD
LLFTYIPPENSTYSQSQGDQFEQLTQDILNYSDKGDILICGDFNGRVSTPG